MLSKNDKENFNHMQDLYPSLSILPFYCIDRILFRVTRTPVIVHSLFCDLIHFSFSFLPSNTCSKVEVLVVFYKQVFSFKLSCTTPQVIDYQLHAIPMTLFKPTPSHWERTEGKVLESKEAHLPYGRKVEYNQQIPLWRDESVLRKVIKGK